MKFDKKVDCNPPPHAAMSEEEYCHLLFKSKDKDKVDR